MFVLIFSEPVYQYWFVRQPRDYSAEKNRLDSLVATMKWQPDSAAQESAQPATRLFAFDPNLSTKNELELLGFSQAMVTRIINYRSKGGRFQAKKDLMKIYGMDSGFYVALAPYISLPENVTKEKVSRQIAVKEKPVFARFDLNLADTSQLIKIYGIGPKLALRIIAYREKLGGFILDNQLREVYGLDSIAVKELLSKSFISENFQPRQVNINDATEKELGSHPYIKYKLAKAIVAYRRQHGAFSSVDDLKKITILEEGNLQKMKPYLLF